jgi:hypothetical protein
VKINRYLIVEGRLRAQPGVAAWPKKAPANLGESWYDVQEGSAEELRQFLTPLNLHPLQLAHCLDSVNDPGVVSFGKSVLMEYPAAFEQRAADRPCILDNSHEGSGVGNRAPRPHAGPG